jgi:streptogramin lyase
MSISRYIFRLLAASSFITAASSAGASPASFPLPVDWYPESIAQGPDGAFYVGSWRQGAIVEIGADGASSSILVPPGSNGLANGQGVLVDASAGLLWVCSGDLGYTTVPSTPSALKSYDLKTGAPRGSYAMPDHGYCNDLAQDSSGTVYVTDSRNPRVLRLRRQDAALAVWKQDTAFKAGSEGFFLNGIALDGDDRLYVSLVSAVPYLLRIDMDEQGGAGPVVRVAMPRVLKNADAIRIYAPGRMAIFESNAFGKDGPYGGQVSLARLEGKRATLDTVISGLNDPSSGVVAGKRIYFIESKYGLLIDRKGKDIPANVPFDVQSRALPE